MRMYFYSYIDEDVDILTSRLFHSPAEAGNDALDNAPSGASLHEIDLESQEISLWGRWEESTEKITDTEKFFIGGWHHEGEFVEVVRQRRKLASVDTAVSGTPLYPWHWIGVEGGG